MRRFLLDAHLGRLAKLLRMLGIDATFENALDDDELLRIAQRDERMLLSRDRALITEAGPEHGYYVRAVPPREQLDEVLQRFALQPDLQPLTRCISCNGVLQSVSKDAVEGRVPHGVHTAFDCFWICSSCDRVYWRGSHYQRMRAFATSVASHT